MTKTTHANVSSSTDEPKQLMQEFVEQEQFLYELRKAVARHSSRMRQLDEELAKLDNRQS